MSRQAQQLLAMTPVEDMQAAIGPDGGQDASIG
jgi:hypothetical protein